MGPAWNHLGPMLGHLGPSWSHVGPMLGHLGAHLGPSGGYVGIFFCMVPFLSRSKKHRKIRGGAGGELGRRQGRAAV